MKLTKTNEIGKTVINCEAIKALAGYTCCIGDCTECITEAIIQLESITDLDKGYSVYDCVKFTEEKYGMPYKISIYFSKDKINLNITTNIIDKEDLEEVLKSISNLVYFSEYDATKTNLKIVLEGGYNG